LKTLFPSNYNWGVFILFAFIIRAVFIDMSLLSFIAVLISIYEFSLLFRSISHIVPTRFLLGSFMCVQFFIGPVLSYNGLGEYQYHRYRMIIPESDYFSYVIPAVVLFIIGLHMNAGKYKGEIIDRKGVENFVEENPMVPYYFISMGFLASIVSTFFASELAFVFYLLGSFKFIGLFLLVLGTRKIKLWAMVLVIGSIVSSSLGTGMFHDLLTWVIYSAAIFAIKYRFSSKIKWIGLSSFILLAFLIQVLKGDYRNEIGKGQEEAGVETFTELYEKGSTENQGLFNIKSFADAAVRINQGFIIANIMKTVPDRESFANGSEMFQIVEAAIMPRFLDPDKLRAGDRTIFRKYSGIPIQAGTSMGLSSVGDAYINWGVFGGVAFMFILGFFYSEVLNMFYKYSIIYPTLILFVPLVFYYPIRPDCELQTILGHLVKSCFLIFVIFQVWGVSFKVNRTKLMHT
jgi:hypothetical protein